MKVVIIDNKGYEGLIEIGEVYEVKPTRSGKALICVNGMTLNLNKEFTLGSYDYI